MIAIKQAKPAGTAGASFHPGLTPSHDLLALMLSSVLLFSSSLWLTLCDIPTPIVQYFIRFCLCSFAQLTRLNSLILFNPQAHFNVAFDNQSY